MLLHLKAVPLIGRMLGRGVLFLATVAISSVSMSGNESFIEVGVTQSMFLQPAIGYWHGILGVRASGIYLNEARQQWQLNLALELTKNEKLQQTVNLVNSWQSGSDGIVEYRYGATGLAYAMNYRGLYFQFGLGVPWLDEQGNLANDPIVPIGSWGFVYQFR